MEKSNLNKIQCNKEPRARAESMCLAENSSKQLHPKLPKKQSSEPNIPSAIKEEINTDYVPNGRQRSSSHRVGCSDYTDDYFIRRNSASLTEKAKNLSQEEMHSLVIDIFKPLDFYEILFERMRNIEHQQETTDGAE